MWMWLGLRLGPAFGAKLALQFWVCLHLSDEGRVGTEPCAPGIAQYNLCTSIPPEHVDPCHHFHFKHPQFLMLVGT